MAAEGWSPVGLLVSASGCVFAGVMCGIDGWGDNLAVGLFFLTVAGVLGALGMGRSGRGSGAAVAGGSARKYWPALGALVLVHTLGAVLYCWKAPATDIDCYTFQQLSEQRLMQGTDPFGQTQANLYSATDTPHYYGPGMVVNGRVQVGLQYPPITLAWILPGYLAGDIRYSYILAVVLSAAALFALSPGVRNLYMVGFLLLNPITFLVENRCWTEPMVLMALCATVYAARARRGWLPVTLGLLLATKQYNFLLLPFVPYLLAPFRWRAYARLMAISIGVALATVAPFAVWNFHALIKDLVLFHLAQPFRHDSLSFAVVSPVFEWAGPLLLAAVVAWMLLRVRGGAAMFAAAYGVVLLMFVGTSKQAFCNYYFLAGNALLLAAAALPPGMERLQPTTDLQPALQSTMDVPGASTTATMATQ